MVSTTASVLRYFFGFLHLVCGVCLLFGYVRVFGYGAVSSQIFCASTGILGVWIGVGIAFSPKSFRLLAFLVHFALFCFAVYIFIELVTAPYIDTPVGYLFIIGGVVWLFNIITLAYISISRFWGNPAYLSTRKVKIPIVKISLHRQLFIFLIPIVILLAIMPYRQIVTEHRINLSIEKLKADFDYRKKYDPRNGMELDINDGWGRKLKYYIHKRNYTGEINVVSDGRDKTPKTKDDLHSRSIAYNKDVKRTELLLKTAVSRYKKTDQPIEESDVWGRSIIIAEKTDDNKGVIVRTITARSLGEDGIDGSADDVVYKFATEKKTAKTVRDQFKSKHAVNINYCKNLSGARNSTLRLIARSIRVRYSGPKDCEKLYKALRQIYRLRILNRFTQKISDLSPLGELVWMKRLSIEFAEVSDLNALAPLQNLTHLRLRSEDLVDISGISGLTKLSKLILMDTSISDIRPLEGLQNLTELRIFSNKLTDITPSKGLNKLTKLSLENTKVDNIGPLKGLSNLTVLYIYSPELTDISALKDLSKLTKLTIKGSQITDISSLEGCTELTELRIESAYLANIDALKGLAKLTKLSLIGTVVEDVGPLRDLKSLAELRIDSSRLADISALAALTKLKVLSLGSDKIIDISTLTELKELSRLDLKIDPSTDIDLLKKLPRLQSFKLNGSDVYGLRAARPTGQLGKEHTILIGLINEYLRTKNYLKFYAPIRHYSFGENSAFLRPGSEVWLYDKNEKRKTKVKHYETKRSCHVITIDKPVGIMLDSIILLSENELPLTRLSKGPSVSENMREAGLEIFRSESFESEVCPWFRPGMALSELPKEEFKIITFNVKKVGYAVLTFPDCEGGEWELKQSILAKIMENDQLEFVGRVTGKPLIDVDGDGFPEFLGFEPYGGGGAYYLTNYLKNHEIVATAVCH